MNNNPFVFLLTIGVFDVLLIFTLTCLGWLGLVVWPARSQAAESTLVAAPARCTVLGLVDVLGGILLLAVVGGMHPGLARLLGVLLVLLLAALLLVGLPGLLASVGERILTLAERPGTRATSTLVGAVTLCGAAQLPWLGWTILLLALLAAVGAAALSSLRRR